MEYCLTNEGYQDIELSEIWILGYQISPSRAKSRQLPQKTFVALPQIFFHHIPVCFTDIHAIQAQKMWDTI